MFLYFSIYSTCKTYIEWQDNPTITTINTTAYPIKNIEFPAITICSQGLAKDVMDTVILRQFESYLKSRGIKEKSDSSQDGIRKKENEGKGVRKGQGKSEEKDPRGKRRKRGLPQSIAKTFSNEEVFRRFFRIK